MKTVLSLYFDGTTVQALTTCACISGGSVTIKDARTFTLGELDNYLSLCNEKSCIISCNPLLFYQDIVHLPPAAAKHYDKLVRAEIKNAHPDLTSFSIYYRKIGESTIDNRQYSKIAVFSYPDDFLAGFIQTVNRHGISISSIYASPYSIFRLALSTCGSYPNQPRIFIAPLPGEKILLVSNNNELEFIRKIPLSEPVPLMEDANSINMTLDYCVQSLRVSPLEAVMLDQSESYSELSQFISVPFRSAMPPRLANIPYYTVQVYLAPLAAALHYSESPDIGDIRPANYISFSRNKKLFATLSIIVFTAVLLLSGYLVAESMLASDLRVRISQLRSELGSASEELATYRKLDAEANLLKQQIDFINRHNSSLDPTAALASLVLPASVGYSIKGVNIQNEEGFLTVRIEGDINASGFSETQSTFEWIVGQLAKIPGYIILSSSVDIKQKSFNVQARYNGIGKQVK